VARIIRERKLEKENGPEVRDLKEKGKQLRDELRAAIANFNSVNDKIIELVISLPNILDPKTPTENNTLLKKVPVPNEVNPWKTPPDLEWTTIPGMHRSNPHVQSFFFPHIHLRDCLFNRILFSV